MKQSTSLFCMALLLCMVASFSGAQSQELPLWEKGIPNNPVKYKQEKMRVDTVREGTLAGQNRIFSQVSEPTYQIYQPAKGMNTHIAMVICPGGGFRDVWIDKEGTDMALWLAQQGITSLVLKYRTFNAGEEGLALSNREDYFPEVYADAKQAIHILRSKAGELDIDKNKIGIGGFSAGGALSFMATLGLFEDKLPAYAKFGENTKPDFACLVYPGISDSFVEAVGSMENIPPMFIANGAEDVKTPALRCVKFYQALLENNVKAELHVYGKGDHGFGLTTEMGHAVATWDNSFIAWLKDLGLMK